MSRYDGLIIPRSYSEYINKTDAATLQQALQLSGVLSGAVAAGDNKAVKSSAVNNALALYTRICKFGDFDGVPNKVYTMDLSNLAINRAYYVTLTSPYANVSYYMGIIFNGSAIQNLKELTNNFFTVTYENKILSMAMTYISNNPFTVQIVGI